MAHDFLKGILGDDLYGQLDSVLKEHPEIDIVNARDGSYIPKGKFDEERTNVKNLRTQLADVQTKLNEAQSSLTGMDALKTQLAQFTQDLASKDAQIRKMGLEHSISDAIREAKPRNIKVIMSMLDMDKIKQSDDGKLEGISDQLDALKKSDPYLFDEAKPSKGGTDPRKDPDPGAQGNQYAEANNALRSAAGYM